MRMTWKRILSALFCLGLLATAALPLTSVNAEAAGDGVAQVKIKYQPNGNTPSSAEGSTPTQGYRLYRIATIGTDENGDPAYQPTEKYDQLFSVRIADNNRYDPFSTAVYENARDLVQAFAQYINSEPSVAADYLAPIVEGEATFSGLPYGLYLGTGPQYMQGRTTYTPMPFVISIPYMIAADGTVLNGADMQAGVEYNNITVNIKWSEYTSGGGGGGGGNKPKPDPDPDPPDHPPDGPGEIIDIGDPDVPRTDHPDLPQDPPEITIDEPDVPLAPANPPRKPPSGTTIIDGNVPLARLPQTGLLWWPVPVMGIAGVVLLLVGWWGRSKAGRGG